jgi:hypothetical protein
MSTWLWVNIPLCAIFFGATAGIPLWMVLKRPDTGDARPAHAAEPRRATQPRPTDPRSPRRREVQPTH